MQSVRCVELRIISTMQARCSWIRGESGYTADARQAEVGAIGGVLVGAVGYPGPSRHPGQGSLGERADAVPHYEPVTREATELS